MARPAIAAGLVIAALGCWLFAGALFSGKVLGGDDLILFAPPFEPVPGHTRPANPYTFDSAWVLHPDMLEARAQLRRFHLPIWASEQGAGQPILASQQTAVLYPLNWLSDVLPFWQSLAWVALLKLLIAASGMLLFCRRLGLARLPSLFGAVSFAFSAYMIGWFAHPHSNVFVLLPWLMFMGDRVVSAARWRDAFALALFVGVTLLGGHPESSLIVLLATVLWCAFRAAATHDSVDGARPWLRRAGLLGAALAIGIGIAAVTLIPFVEMLGQSLDPSRSGGPGPRSILQSFVLPEQWGRPDKFSLGGGPLNYQERTAYFGALPLLLGAAGLVIRRSRTQLFFLALGLLALGLAVDIPVYSSLAAQVPGLNVIYRVRALIVCTFAGAALGAFGLQAVLEASPTERRRVLVAVSVAALPVLVWLAFQVDWSAPLGPALDQLPVLGHKRQAADVVRLATALRWVILTAAGLAIVAAMQRPRFATGAAIAAIALTGADLVTLDRGYIPAIPLAEANPPAPGAVRYAQAHLGHERVGGGKGLPPNLAERFHLRGSRVHGLPALKRRTVLWFELGGTGLPQRLVASPPRLGSLFSVKYVFFGRGRHLSDPQTRLAAPGVYVNRAALPRAWVAYNWEPASTPGDALHVMKMGSRDTDLTRPVIEGAAPPSRPDSAHPVDPARFVRDGETAVELRVRARRPGYVVLGDTYYPGWRATVDGHGVPIRAANVAFRAVAVPAGAHSVRFDYRPLSVGLGLGVSAFALLLAAGGLVFTRGGAASWTRTVRRARRPPA